MTRTRRAAVLLASPPSPAPRPSVRRRPGANAMFADGLYERFPKPEYAVAFHVSSDPRSGTIEVPPGIVASSSDSVDVTVHGVGAHGASPHQGVDPMLVASQIVVPLQSRVSRTINPLDSGVVTVGSIHGGSKHDIIGDRVDLQPTSSRPSAASRGSASRSAARRPSKWARRPRTTRRCSGSSPGRR